MAALPIIVVTGFWAVIGLVLPILIQFCMKHSPTKGMVQVILAMTAFCCYLFWLCAYLAQLNPLFGPQLDTELIRAIQLEWHERI